MTEAEWLACDHPLKMIAFLKGRASDRKLRLFAVACHRAVYPTYETGFDKTFPLAEVNLRKTPDWTAAQRAERRTKDHRALLLAERHADGDGDESALRYVDLDAYTPIARLAWPDAHAVARVSFESTRDYVSFEQVAPIGHERFLLDVFGNPFRPCLIDPVWLTASVRAVAAAAYEERALPAADLDAIRLNVLADALEDAGCADSDVLSHLRGPGPHVRGCWAVDLCLGLS